mmetsp:Transcript_49665/g.94912  ORF Transcript_49665/g.94912 Transcript_49665/m.94912 type:complete len:209 (-) Transcript_49665:256-882(-)
MKPMSRILSKTSTRNLYLEAEYLAQQASASRTQSLKVQACLQMKIHRVPDHMKSLKVLLWARHNGSRSTLQSSLPTLCDSIKQHLLKLSKTSERQFPNFRYHHQAFMRVQTYGTRKMLAHIDLITSFLKRFAFLAINQLPVSDIRSPLGRATTMSKSSKSLSMHTCALAAIARGFHQIQQLLLVLAHMNPVIKAMLWLSAHSTLPLMV